MQVIVGAIWFTSSIVLAQVPDFESPHHPTHVLVQFQSGVNQAGRQSAHEDAGALQVLKVYSAFEGLQLVEVSEEAVEDAVLAYSDNPDVLFAEPDYERELTTVCNSNDPYLQGESRRFSRLKPGASPLVNAPPRRLTSAFRKLSFHT